MQTEASAALAKRLITAEPRVCQKFEELSRRQAALRNAPSKGVSYGGLTLAPRPNKTPSELLDEAEREVADQRAWEASADGQFYAHLTTIETCVQAIHQTLEMVRTARNRGFTVAVNRSAAVARLEEIAAAARRIQTAATLGVDFAAAMPASQQAAE